MQWLGEPGVVGTNGLYAIAEEFDEAAALALGWDEETAGPLAHCGVVGSAALLVSCTLTDGVALYATQRIAAAYGQDVWAVLRPPAPERNHDGLVHV